MRSQSQSFRALSKAFSKLQKEVGAITKLVHGQALKQASNGDENYLAHVSALINELIEKADARGQVICFASAAELGLSLYHHGERCRQAAVHTRSDSVLALYWAVIRRMHKRRSDAASTGDRLSESGPAASSATDNRPGNEQGGSNPTLLSATELCQLCTHLSVDKRCATGHDALHPISDKYFLRVGQSLLSEAQGYQCRACQAMWTQYKHSADPFTMWAIKKSP